MKLFIKKYLLPIFILVTITFSSKMAVSTYSPNHGHLPVYTGQFLLYINGNSWAMTSNGTHLFAGNFFGNSISIYKTNGQFIKNFGGSGSGNGQFNGPNGIVYAKNHLYVVDMFNYRIDEFTTNGVFVSKFGSKGTGKGQFSEPYKIATDGSKLYVTDDVQEQVSVFDLNGNFIRKIGTSYSNSPNGIMTAYGVTVSNGRVYVSDYGFDNIKVYNSTSGKYLSTIFYTYPSRDQIKDPFTLVSDSHYLYIGDYTGGDIFIFDLNGNYQSTYYGAANVEYSQPNAQAMTLVNGKLYVGDANQVCRVYATLTPPQDVSVYQNIGSLGLTVSWKGPQYEENIGIKSYLVYRSTDNSNFQYYLTTQNKYFVDQSVTLGTTYYYKVAAVALNSQIGVSGLSSAGSGKLSAVSTNSNGGLVPINFSFVIIGLVTSVVLIQKRKKLNFK